MYKNKNILILVMSINYIIVFLNFIFILIIYGVQKIDKIFGYNNFDEFRYQNQQFGKSQIIYLNYLDSSNRSGKRNERNKRQKNNISSFKKLLTVNEDENIISDKSNISNYVGKIEKFFKL